MKNKLFICLLLSVIFFPAVYAYRIIDNNGSTDYGISVLPSADGGCIIAGHSMAPQGITNAMVIRLYSDGSTAWVKEYNGSTPVAPFDRIMTQIIPSSENDGGFFLTGILSAPSYTEGYLMLIDSNFNFSTDNYSGSGSGNYWVKSAAATSDNGYIVAGYTDDYSGDGSYDMYYSKADYLGNSVWESGFGGSGDDRANFITKTAEGFLLSGRTNSAGNGGYDAFMLRLDSEGNTITYFTVGGAGDDRASVAYEDSGGYIIAGATTSYGAGEYDMYLVKTDAAGNTLWYRTYGGPNNDYCYYMEKSRSGGYLLVGGSDASDAAGTTTDMHMVMTYADGSVRWEKKYSFAGIDDLYSLCRTTDGNYIAVGTMNEMPGVSQVFAVKFDENGNDLWSAPLYQPAGPQGQASEGDSYVCPQPAKDSLNFVFSLNEDADVTINIFTINGKNAGKTSVKGIQTSRNTAYFNAASLPPGMYYYLIKARTTDGKNIGFKPGKFAVER